MDFSVRLRNPDPARGYFVITSPPGSDDHYVQGEIVNGSYGDGISLGEEGEYFPEFEEVAVYETTAGVASRIRQYVGRPGERSPIEGWGGLTPAPRPLGAIGVSRRPEGECGG